MARLQLTSDLAADFVAIALGHVRREYPNKLDHVLAGAEDARTPSALHPIFYGSLDWHSCVHGYWMLRACCAAFRTSRSRAISSICSTNNLSPKKWPPSAPISARPTPRFRAPLRLGVAFETGRGTQLPRRPALVGGARAASRDLRAEVSRLPAARRLSRARRRSCEHRFWSADGRRLCGNFAGRRLGGAAARDKRAMVWLGRRLSGMGRTERRRFPIARPHRGRVRAPPAPGVRVSLLVRQVPAGRGARRADDAVPTGDE